jgi:hypothetical protein
MKAIKQAAILYNGVVFKGDRHRNIIAQHKHIPLNRGMEGFITSQGLFLNREEAAKIAYQTGQIKKPKQKLISEDLY